MRLLLFILIVSWACASTLANIFSNPHAEKVAQGILGRAATDECPADPTYLGFIQHYLSNDICGSKYNALGVRPECTVEEVNAAAMKLKKELCGRRFLCFIRGQRKEAYEKVKDAQSCLSNDECRMDYDKK